MTSAAPISCAAIGNLRLEQTSWFVFLVPPLASNQLTGLEVLGEVPLMLWLLTMGINSQRWNDRAAANAARSVA